MSKIIPIYCKNRNYCLDLSFVNGSVQQKNMITGPSENYFYAPFILQELLHLD